MKIKNVAFELPFIGYDYGYEHQWIFDVLIGKYGNPVIGLKIKNTVEQYSADPEMYIQFHALLNQIVSILGDGCIFQKLDIFTKKAYQAESAKTFLQQKYSEHFNGREYKKIDTLLIFTLQLNGKKKKKRKFLYSDKSYKSFREKSIKIQMLLHQYHCEAEFLMEKDWEFYIARIMGMKFRDIPRFDNVLTTSEHLRFGERFVKTISLVDVEKLELPNEIEPYTVLGGTGSAAATAIDNFSFLNELEDYETMVFHQVISIPEQVPTQRELEKRKKKLESMAQNSPSNAINAQEIEALLANIATDGALIVDTHLSITYSATTKEDFEKTESTITNKLFTKNIFISENSYNQMELYRATIPGNAVELMHYDYFMTESQAALCFFFKESYPIDEKSNFYLRFTDRQGVPIKIDLADLPMKQGRINNRNKFVLGPSGSGKSFLMNNIIEQYLTYNYDVVIVDTGDSYSGTCAYKGGKYIQYTEENPITMNPFLMSKEEFNIEKIEFLSNLIFLIWKGADAEMTTTHKSIIDNALMSYYHHYFNKNENWYQDRTTDELIIYLKKYNIHEEELHADFDKSQREKQNYYELLGVAYDDSTDYIKEKGRKLVKYYHPDSNQDKTDYDLDMFYRVFDAYETLTDDNKRQIYNETQLLLAKASDLIQQPKDSDKTSGVFRNAVIKRIQRIEKELAVKELSFNSFYDYCEKFLPIYLNNRKHKINENEFNLRTFLFVLKDFYKGGRYGRTLNENADNSLFDEPFIVFEIDNVKDNPKLFPIVTLIIMDTFIQKMRLRKDRRKALIIEEAWKAIASKLMGGYILYLYKTIRKFWGETIVVTQELEDIIGNAVVKDSIINNSDTFILLDQTKFKDNFDRIASLLSLNQVEQNKIFTINNLNNKFNRSYFKEFYVKRGSKGEVYGNEVALEQYLTYTTEKPEKTAMEYYANYYGNYDDAIVAFVLDVENFKGNLGDMVTLINLYKAILNEDVMNYYKKIKTKHPQKNPLSIIQNQMDEQHLTLQQLIKNQLYETV